MRRSIARRLRLAAEALDAAAAGKKRRDETERLRQAAEMMLVNLLGVDCIHDGGQDYCREMHASKLGKLRREYAESLRR